MKRPSPARVGTSARANRTACVGSMHATVSGPSSRQPDTMDDVRRAAIGICMLSTRRKLLRHRDTLSTRIQIESGRGVRWVIDRRSWVFDVGCAFILRHGRSVVEVKPVVRGQVLTDAEVPLQRQHSTRFEGSVGRT
jgi:hypothetical protein